MSGVTLDTVIEHVAPTTELILEPGSLRVAEVKGSHADIFELFQSVMRFNYTSTVSEDRAWGTLKEDGSWSGNG